MITREFAQTFAYEWINAWNSQNLNQVLSHYHDDFVMSSPKIAAIAQEPSGVLHGKKNIAAYWQRALELIPDLHFTLIDIFIGSDSLILHYQGPSGLAAEVFFFNADRMVVKAAANYI
jgi:ketosteroid isomerase-like protein